MVTTVCAKLPEVNNGVNGAVNEGVNDRVKEAEPRTQCVAQAEPGNEKKGEAPRQKDRGTKGKDVSRRSPLG